MRQRHGKPHDLLKRKVLNYYNINNISVKLTVNVTRVHHD